MSKDTAIKWDDHPEHDRYILEQRLKRSPMSFSSIGKKIGTSKYSVMRRFNKLLNEIDVDEFKEEIDDGPVYADLEVPKDFDFDEWYKLVDKLSEETNELDPIITSSMVWVPTDKPIIFSPSGDWHLGSRFVAYKTFRALLDLVIDTPRFYWGLFGDLADNFPLDWMPPAIMQVIQPMHQWRLIQVVAQKLMDEKKVLFAFWGNHNHFSEKKTGEDPEVPVWRGRVPYFHGKGVVTLRVGKEYETAEQYIIYGGHKLRGNSQYNTNHPQVKALLWDVPQADFIISAHTHNFGYQEVVHHEQAFLAGLHKNRIAHLVQIGSPKIGPDPHTIRGWSNGIFEWPIFVLYPDRHEIKRIYDFKDIEHYLGITLNKDLLEKLEEAKEKELP